MAEMEARMVTLTEIVVKILEVQERQEAALKTIAKCLKKITAALLEDTHEEVRLTIRES